jgi:hypothetical protein
MVKLKGELQEIYPMTGFGEMKKNLGNRIEKDRDKGNLTISQSHCTDTILARFGTSNADSVSTPLHKMTKLMALLDRPGPSTGVPYAKAIRSLVYDTQHATRFGIHGPAPEPIHYVIRAGALDRGETRAQVCHDPYIWQHLTR